jgi:hypothetical protein
VALPDPVIHLYWAYALAKVDEMFKVTRLPPGVCGAQAEREYVTLNPKKSPARFVGASYGEGRKRAGEMSSGLCATICHHDLITITFERRDMEELIRRMRECSGELLQFSIVACAAQFLRAKRNTHTLLRLPALNVMIQNLVKDQHSDLD